MFQTLLNALRTIYVYTVVNELLEINYKKYGCCFTLIFTIIFILQFLVIVDGRFHLVVYADVKMCSGAYDDDEQPRGYDLVTNLIKYLISTFCCWDFSAGWSTLFRLSGQHFLHRTEGTFLRRTEGTFLRQADG